MITAAIKINSSPLANFNTPNWENIETTIIYPSNSIQNNINNPPSVHDIIIDTLGNVWSIVSLFKEGSTLNYKMSLLLKSDIPSIDIIPNFGDTKAGIITPNASNEVAPYWDSSFVDINVLKIAAQYNNSLSPTNNLSAIKTVDGSGSGLDSDSIDGLDSTAFSLVGHSHLNVTNTTAGFMSSSDKIKLDAITGTNTGDQTTISGNAGSATVLQTARTINGVSFNGSANITINAVDSTARIASSLIGAANGVAPLDSTSKIPSIHLPSYVDAILEYANVASFPVVGIAGTMYVALDTNKVYRWSGSVYIYITSGAVDSVAGKTGVVTLVKADVGLANVDNTSDLSKPVSTAQQTALDLKANLASPTFTGTVSGITKSMVGLANVDNTSDLSKPVSTAQQTALDLKANLASPTFTGTVNGITKSMVGLANVDNTSDLSKPISTAQQTALSIVQSTASSDATTKANAAQAAAIAASAPLVHIHSVVTTTVNGFMSAIDKVKLDSIIFRNTSIVSNNITTTIDDFLIANYRSAEYNIQISQGTNYTIVKLLLIHNGTNVFINEYGLISTSTVIGTLDAIISSGSVLLQLSNFGNATSSTVDVKLSRIILSL